MEGDLGPYDAPAARLARADNVLTLDFGLMRFVWRAVRRSREKADFWRWLLTWRRRARPTVLHAVAALAPRATVHVVHTPRALRAFLLTARTTEPPPTDAGAVPSSAPYASGSRYRHGYRPGMLLCTADSGAVSLGAGARCVVPTWERGCDRIVGRGRVAAV